MYLQELQLPRYRRGDSLALCWGIWQAARITRDDLEEQELIALLGPHLNGATGYRNNSTISSRMLLRNIALVHSSSDSG